MIPADAHDISPGWLNTVDTLRRDAEIVDCSTTRIGEDIGFICRIFRVQLTWNRQTDGCPDSIVAKLNSVDPQHDRYWARPGFSAYEKEARFYHEVAPGANLRTPECYYHEIDRDARRSVLLLEDMVDARPGDQVDGCSAEDAITAARDWACFNATFWENNRLREVPDLPGYTAGIENLQERFNVAWSAYLDQFSDQIPDKIRQIGQALMGSGATYVRGQLDRSPKTLCHGDLHLDNLFFTDEPPGIAVIDWNGLRAGPGMWDLSHLMCQGLEAEIRRGCENDIFSAYCETLAAHGVKGYGVAEAWRDYRLSLLTHIQKLARGQTMQTTADRHHRLRDAIRRRTFSAVEDHCTINLIGEAR